MPIYPPEKRVKTKKSKKNNNLIFKHMETLSTYEIQANDFLAKTNATIEKKFLKYDFHFEGEKDKRDIYEITIKRGSRKMVFNFGQSLNNSGVKIVNKNNGKVLRTYDKSQYLKKDGSFDTMVFKFRCGWQFPSRDKIVMPIEPTNYDILACLAKYDPDTFENFCSEFVGYDTDSKKAEKIYKAVKKEFSDLQALFTDEELTELQEIN